MRVLLVDDEEEFRSVVARRLGRRGYEVIGAENGERAVELAVRAREEGECFEAVVLDMKMPGMGGLAALGELRRLCPEMEVLILSGHASMDAAMAGMRQGAFDYLLKPVDIEELAARLEDVREGRSRGGKQGG